MVSSRTQLKAVGDQILKLQKQDLDDRCVAAELARLPRFKAEPSEHWSPFVIGSAELGRLLDLEEEMYFAKKKPSEPTTLMVRNIASSLTGDKVREHLCRLGFDGAYDFFYLPKFCRGSTNQGYFFLNLKTSEDAAAFRERLQGAPLGSPSGKLCDVSAAEWQGLKELREHFRKKAVMRGEHRPLFL